MCIWTNFRYLCQCRKWRIATPCDKAYRRDVDGALICPEWRPDATSLFDGWRVTHTNRAPDTFGMGICSNIHCQWWFGLLPVGNCGGNINLEVDYPIDDSNKAKADREDYFYRKLLSTDQQLEHFQVSEYRSPVGQASRFERLMASTRAVRVYGLAGDASDFKPEDLKWYDLNPKHLTAEQLQTAVWLRLLPTEIVFGKPDPRLSPLRPTQGPFKIKPHTCRKTPGICRTCGENVGFPWLKEREVAYQQRQSFIKIAALKLSLKDYYRMPIVWSIETNEWCKIENPDPEKYHYQTLYSVSKALPHVPFNFVPNGYIGAIEGLRTQKVGEDKAELRMYPELTEETEREVWRMVKEMLGWLDVSRSDDEVANEFYLKTFCADEDPDVALPPRIVETKVASSAAGLIAPVKPFDAVAAAARILDAVPSSAETYPDVANKYDDMEIDFDC